MTAAKDRGTGKALKQSPVRKSDCVLASRGYSTAVGLENLAAAGGYVTVRANTGSLLSETPEGLAMNLRASVETLTRPRPVGEWPAQVAARSGSPVHGPDCALRKTDEPAEITHAKIHRTARKKVWQVRPETLRRARSVIAFTTVPPTRFPRPRSWNGTA